MRHESEGIGSSFLDADWRAFEIRSDDRKPPMLADLEQKRAAVLRQISELEDFRAGSITGTGEGVR
jgi:hypothetical protein